MKQIPHIVDSGSVKARIQRKLDEKLLRRRIGSGNCSHQTGAANRDFGWYSAEQPRICNLAFRNLRRKVTCNGLSDWYGVRKNTLGVFTIDGSMTSEACSSATLDRGKLQRESPFRRAITKRVPSRIANICNQGTSLINSSGSALTCICL